MYLPFKPVSVRTYNVALKAGLRLDCAEDATFVADLCCAGLVRNGGIKTAIELYRAAGYGAWNIWKNLQYSAYSVEHLTLEDIKRQCERFDYELHQPLD